MPAALCRSPLTACKASVARSENCGTAYLQAFIPSDIYGLKRTLRVCTHTCTMLPIVFVEFCRFNRIAFILVNPVIC